MIDCLLGFISVFFASNKDKNTTVRISVKSSIYGWKIDLIIIIKNYNPSRFPNSLSRGKFSFELISDSHDLLRLISGFMRPIRTQIPLFDSL
jgi:hypothetical protein